MAETPELTLIDSARHRQPPGSARGSSPKIAALLAIGVGALLLNAAWQRLAADHHFRVARQSADGLEYQGTIEETRAWTRAHANLSLASRADPANADYAYGVARLYEYRANTPFMYSGQSDSDRQTAVGAFEQTVGRRLVWGKVWGRVAVNRGLLDRGDPNAVAAFENVVRFGQFDPRAQIHIVTGGMLLWDELSEATRASTARVVESMLDRGVETEYIVRRAVQFLWVEQLRKIIALRGDRQAIEDRLSRYLDD